MQTELEIQRYIPHPEKEGMLKYDGNISLQKAEKAIRGFLDDKGHSDRLDYFAASYDRKYARTEPFPKYHWIAVFAVTGGSEGHYIHVESISEEKRELLFLGKTFEGMEYAYEVARDLAIFLQA